MYMGNNIDLSEIILLYTPDFNRFHAVSSLTFLDNSKKYYIVPTNTRHATALPRINSFTVCLFSSTDAQNSAI